MRARLLLPSSRGGGGFIANEPPPPAGPIPPQGDPLPDVFTKHPSNPVLLPGTNPDWDWIEIAGESVFYDTRLDTYVMSYSGQNGGSNYFTGLAYSDDLITWTKEATNPVFDPEVHVAPTIIQRGPTDYVMYYQPYPSSIIKAAGSSDLLTWSVLNGGSHVLPIRPGEFDSANTFDPNARIRSDGTIEVFYTYNGSGIRGIATALSDDGINFTDRRQLFANEPGEDINDTGAPAVLASSDTEYSLFYDASVTSGFRYISRQRTTDDGATFDLEQVVLEHGGVGEWDSVQDFDPAPIWADGVLYLIFTGAPVGGNAANLQAKLGLASMDWPS